MGSTIATDDTFKEMIAGSPILVDFWATWCGPCKMLAPIIEEIAEEYDGTTAGISGIRKLRVAKLDVDDNPNTATEFGVRSIPTLILFKDGKEVERMIGAVPKVRILEKINTHL